MTAAVSLRLRLPPGVRSAAGPLRDPPDGLAVAMNGAAQAQ